MSLPESTERKPATPTCRYHCASCGRHFTSLAAFDRHRQGSYDERRYCASPHDVNTDADDAGLAPRLAVHTAQGECRIGGASKAAPVELWGVPE